MDEEVFFDRLGLKEYEAEALHTLFTVGRTTAPNLAEGTGIPKARVYEVLDSLSQRGFIEIIPGRPKEYQPKSPEEVLDRAKENRRQEHQEFIGSLEDIRKDFVERYIHEYENASEEITPTEELFHVVDVGEPSERETRRLYHDADRDVKVITKGFEYMDRVEASLSDALDRGVKISIIFLQPRHLGEGDAEIQRGIIDQIEDNYPEVEYKFSERPLPWRGTFSDPSTDYTSGEAVLLVEEKEIPLHMRQAAVTENASFVAGLSRYFDLIWGYESAESI